MSEVFAGSKGEARWLVEQEGEEDVVVLDPMSIIGPSGIYKVGPEVLQDAVDAVVLRQVLQKIFLTREELLTRERGTSREVQSQMDALQAHMPEVYQRVMAS